MTCDRYRPLLALLIGNDLDPREAAEVRQHMSDCATCQAQWAALQASIGALQMVSRQAVVTGKGSLMSQVAQRIGARPQTAADATPGWPTLGVFAAACAAVLWLTVSTPVFDFDFRDPQFADSDESPVPAARANGEQFPQLQFVGTSQPVVPVQLSPESVEQPANRAQISPRILGGPRSF